MGRAHEAPSQPSSDGFTIVELLLVLAIAAVILMMVFMAIPALIRNSHNNQRKQDVSLVLEAVSHYELNDSGNFPQPCGGGQPACDQAVGTSNDYFLHSGAKGLTYYVNNQVVLSTGSTTGPQTNPNDLNTVYVYNYQKCNTNGNGNGTNVGAGYNDVVALYAIETSAGHSPKCEQL